MEVTERIIQSVDDMPEADWSSAEILAFGSSGPAMEAVVQSEFDIQAAKTIQILLANAREVLAPLAQTGLMSPGAIRSVEGQATLILQAQEQTEQEWTGDYGIPPNPATNQLSLEDFMTTLDFIPIPRGIRLELYEQQMFEENHITGTCLQRLAAAVTRRGWEYTQIGSDEHQDEDDKAEIAALDEWIDGISSYSDFREIIEHTAAEFQACSNAYIEVIRADFDATAVPAGMDTCISSTMRVIRGHRGYIQWLMGQFRWFNPYMPNIDDRVAGVKLWENYWQGRGVDPYGDDFLRSPWARTITSSMPQYVWNPFLTEVIHIKDLSMSSKYYGFPKDYRLGKLDALMQWSLDYNISLQKNSRIPPFVILFHGKLDPASREDIKQYFASMKGPDNWGNVPIIQAPSMSIGGAGGTKAGLELIKIAGEDKEGMFLELWARAIKDIAMHYGIPLDLLTTENSNRATVTEAVELFNENTVGRFHQIFEDRLKKITKYDLGFTHRYIHFIDLDTDGRMDKANEAKLWHDMGVLNPNEIRKTFLSLAPRPGGDQYFGAFVMPEDEASEIVNVARANELENNPQKLQEAEDAAASSTGQAPTAQAPDNSQLPVAQESWKATILQLLYEHRDDPLVRELVAQHGAESSILS